MSLRFRCFLFCFSLALPTWGMSQPECTSYQSQWLTTHVRFCLQRSRPELPINNEPVVYFLHGLGGNETTWAKGNYSEHLNTLASEDPNFPAMTFVSFETQVDSFFSDFQGESTGRRSYESWFINEFVPMVESKFGVCRERSCRGVAGVSMGGYGALKLALKYPDMFSVAAANSPALPPFSIFEENEKWRDYFSNTPIGVVKGMLLLKDVRNIFSTEELYEANDPIVLVRRYANSAPLPKLYFDVGSEDNFGFEVGHQVFKEALEGNGFEYSSFIEEGGNHFIYHHRGKALLKFLRENLLP